MTSERSALRVGLKKGGCAGMEYTMDIVDAVGENDMLIEVGGARVVLAPTVQMFLIGTRIDYETSLLESGFSFKNPNVASACGCGESVSFSVKELQDQGPDGIPMLRQPALPKSGQ